MKRLKKTLALALALILALAMSTAVFADDVSGGETYSIKITNSVSGHTYEAYQILAGDYSNGKLSNVTWGTGIAQYNGSDVVSSTTSASSVAEALATAAVEDEAKAAEDFISKITLTAVCTKSDNGVLNGDNYVYTISDLAAGYYLVKDADTSNLTGGDAYTSYILKVAGNVEATAKTTATTSEKKVLDTNDSENSSAEEWHDSADYDIGDEVPFKLTATITGEYNYYSEYYLAFHDTESKGLTFNAIKEVYVLNGETKTILTEIEDYTLDTKPTDNHTFDVVLRNLKKNSAITAGSQIVVEYTSVLNTEAEIGAAGNKNEMYVEYSNNPNSGYETSRGNTPTDLVKVFTYKLVINKTDDQGKPLENAGFTLYKKDISVNAETAGYKKFGEDFYKIITPTTDNDGTTFIFKGLDDGEYILSETLTPKGYNTISDIAFTITAGHDETSQDPQLNSLSGGQTEDGKLVFTLDKENGTLTKDVVNKSGSVLPSTGGTGRVLLYVVGAILVVGVGVILVSKKRAQQ